MIVKMIFILNFCYIKSKRIEKYVYPVILAVYLYVLRMVNIRLSNTIGLVVK
jgi:hypothetical protein